MLGRGDRTYGEIISVCWVGEAGPMVRLSMRVGRGEAGPMVRLSLCVG